ncbi:MAG: twitching motility protein PilT [Candidatus Dormibacteria bacterium]
MSAVVLDAGAFVALDRGDRAMAARLRVAQGSGLELRSNGAVVAQVWRESAGRQAVLSRLLRSVDVRAVDRSLGQEAGVLLGRAGRGDAVDATVVAVANTGDRIITSDPADIRALVEASGRAVFVITS